MKSSDGHFPGPQTLTGIDMFGSLNSPHIGESYHSRKGQEEASKLLPFHPLKEQIKSSITLPEMVEIRATLKDTGVVVFTISLLNLLVWSFAEARWILETIASSTTK